MKPGETRDIEATFPPDYQQTDLAGKTAVFTITLHEVKELELPALDDELAKAVSQHQTLDELKADIRKRLQAAAEARIKRETGNTLVERLVEAHDFPLPDVMVEREIDGMVTDGAGMAARMGMSFEDYLKAVGQDRGRPSQGVPRERRKAREGHPDSRGDREGRKHSRDAGRYSK